MNWEVEEGWDDKNPLWGRELGDLKRAVIEHFQNPKGGKQLGFPQPGTPFSHITSHLPLKIHELDPAKI